MYLTPQRAKRVLEAVSGVSAGRCRLFFDYAYAEVIRGEGGVETKICTAEVKVAGEPWQFGIEKGGLAEFLQQYRFLVLKEWVDRNLLTDRDGGCQGNVFDSVSWALAERVN
ncbi:hypothetical protein ABK905_18280 [Acerihabitans sp. KWT182]|uniref:Uncharacterized protein n=1 Tax=Acerihabitans sp. KWT182 TaxID=3157919 RepID=A0AAU7Q6J3_9GAMM